ncbi:MAG: hypothetical protein L0H37_10375, partial [Nitrosospira sp.]|nr:hypothetical protein [Nitrosospira sp.]
MAHQATAHDRLRASLDLAGLELRASEVHGLVCGDICRQRRHGYDSDVASLVGVAAAASGEQA